MLIKSFTQSVTGIIHTDIARNIRVYKSPRERRPVVVLDIDELLLLLADQDLLVFRYDWGFPLVTLISMVRVQDDSKVLYLKVEAGLECVFCGRTLVESICMNFMVVFTSWRITGFILLLIGITCSLLEILKRYMFFASCDFLGNTILVLDR